MTSVGANQHPRCDSLDPNRSELVTEFDAFRLPLRVHLPPSSPFRVGLWLAIGTRLAATFVLRVSE
jgi:hypothetical protein